MSAETLDDVLYKGIMHAPRIEDARSFVDFVLTEDLRQRIIPAKDSILYACKVLCSQ